MSKKRLVKLTAAFVAFFFPQRRHARRKRPLALECLDRRQVCAGVITQHGVATITATDIADDVRLEQTPTHVRVLLNGQTHLVARAGLARIDAFLGAGDDYYNGTPVTVPQRIYGGAGSDSLIAGQHNDALWGEAGNDVLAGNPGRDYVHGGPGTDWLYGNAGPDTIVAQDGGFHDRLVRLESIDNVYGDVLDFVPATHTQDHRTNFVSFFGRSIELRRADAPPGTSGIFYTVRINGVQYQSLWRAVNVISLFTPFHGGTVTIDPQLRSELEAKGLLRLEKLA